jgi:CheY-like chemotaxis protein
VLLSVNDSGSGMDKETLAHIFEPFFTTKGVGRGTGLGLATVYGVVKQNEGFIRVYSEPGMGTTFNIYLPQTCAVPLASKSAAETVLPPSRGETILVVEDDPTLLQMGELMLQRLGYSVLCAGTPAEAIRWAAADDIHFDLFITDVVMPEMNGRELADRILSLRPTVKHLFMSGYTADVIVHRGVLDEAVNFIQKPFSLHDMAVKIRVVLDKA